MNLCVTSRRSCTSTSMRSSPRSSSATSRRCAASRSSSAAWASVAWWRPRRTRRARSVSGRRCRRPRRGRAVRMRRSSSGASTPTGPPAGWSCGAARAVAAGRAAVPRRGVRRPGRVAARARPVHQRSRPDRRRAQGRRARGDRRTHGVGRGRHVEADRQDRQRARQAGRRGRHPARLGAGPARADAGHRHPRRRTGHCRHGCARSASAPWRSCAGSARSELVRVVGQAHGSSLYALARADDDRPVVAERETKSVSVEDTFERRSRRPGAARGDRRPARPQRVRTAVEGAAVGSHGHRQGAAARLHDVDPVGDHRRPDRPARGGEPTRAWTARRPRHLRRRTAARRRGLGPGRLDPGRPVRRGGGRPGRAAGGVRRRRRGRTQPAASRLGLDARRGRRAPGVRAGLGVGLRARAGDGAVRDGGDRAGAGADVGSRRSGSRTPRHHDRRREDEIGGTEPDRPDVPARTTPATPD